MRWALVSLTLVLLLVVSPAIAQRLPEPNLPPSPTEQVVMRLDYTGVPGCSDREAFTLALIPLVHGWDPLASGGRWRLVVALARDALGYSATAELYAPKGDLAWSRSIPAKVTCLGALEVLAVVLAIYIDPPEGLPLPPPPPAATPPVPECPAPPPAPLEPAKLPPATSRQSEAAPTRDPDPEPPSTGVPPEPLPGLGFRAGANVLAETYATGQLSIGFAVDVGLRYRWFSAAIEGRVDPPLGPPPNTAYPLSDTRVMGGLHVCVHHESLMLCGMGEAGGILFPVAAHPIAARRYAAAGIRAGFLLPAGDPRLGILLMGEILAPINRASVEFGQQTAYQTASVNGGLLVGLVFGP